MASSHSMPGQTTMHLGSDLDGTIAMFDRVFHKYAVEVFGMPPSVTMAKNAVRKYVRAMDHGESLWVELQGIVYGARMSEADVAPGVVACLRGCAERGIKVSVVSHKTRMAASGSGYDLHKLSREWLKAHGLENCGGHGPKGQSVFFEPTREAKIQRIREIGCTHFVDDLPEVLSDPSFPADVIRILYTNESPSDVHSGIICLRTWHQIADYLWNRE